MGLSFFLCLPVYLKSQSQLAASGKVLRVKFDDFDKQHGWWSYHKDGTPAQDEQAIINGRGYLKITLQNPIKQMECNVGISEDQNIYSKAIKKLTMEARIKLLTPMKPGSRGWGFWKSRKSQGGQSLAWFMQQYLPQNEDLSWHLVGTVAGKKRRIRNWQPDLENWHVYKIERDLTKQSTSFFIDNKLYFNTPGLVPAGRLSFHLWIDNQVYSKEGILRTGWAGQSSLLVDYVKITTATLPAIQQNSINFPAVLFYQNWNDVFTGQGIFDIAQIKFNTANNKALCLIHARLEKYDGYDADDTLWLCLDDQPLPVKELTGHSNENRTESFWIPLNLSSGGAKEMVEHELRLKGRTSPVLYDLLILDESVGRWLINKQNISLLKKAMQFNIKVEKDKPLLIYCAASVNEAPDYNHLRSLEEMEKEDGPSGTEDHLTINLLNSGQELIQTWEYCGNQVFGGCQAKSMVIHPKDAFLQLRLKGRGQPQIHNLMVFQMN